MPPLHPLVTLPTPANGNVEAPHPTPAYDLFLVLRPQPLHRKRPTTVRTLGGSGYLELFLYLFRDRPLIVLVRGRSGFPSWPFGVAVGRAPGKRSRWAPPRVPGAAVGFPPPAAPSLPRGGGSPLPTARSAAGLGYLLPGRGAAPLAVLGYGAAGSVYGETNHTLNEIATFIQPLPAGPDFIAFQPGKQIQVLG
jgi:hypothetical protein